MTSDTTRWRTSSYSGSQGGNCVEVVGHDGRVLVRDAKDRDGGILRFSPAAWQHFTGQMQAEA